MRHGAGVAGVTIATVRVINKMAARVRGKTTGRSNFARLAMDGFNPWHMMFLDPLVAWTKGIWDNALKEEVLENAWRHAQTTAGVASDAMRCAEGVAGAYIAVLRQLLWAAPSFDCIQTGDLDNDGIPIKLWLKQTCPRVVLSWARRRMAEMDAESSEMAKRIGGPPDLEPLAAIVIENIFRFV